MTKPIVFVKICYNIVSHSRSLIYFASWPQLISNLLPLFAVLLLIGLALFYTPGVFVQHFSNHGHLIYTNF